MLKTLRKKPKSYPPLPFFFLGKVNTSHYAIQEWTCDLILNFLFEGEEMVFGPKKIGREARILGTTMSLPFY